ncbi:S-layer homology domain-containing protein [Intestinimonas sp. MSJ-38]|uniref:S-layer homology domain-containing protein n=1 Tax=Intestinimonas sp. MSJ-38 TaxID=2841532 RepID=UPI001C108924|nr:S-layer homology domain-containing protein [Intestinimonas sp. MSJ-38]MBU5431409.1 S-layer homology domain-containing protein [Intestinimonas sp. MSJ-38]
MRRQKNLQRAASVTLSALLLAGAAASPALAANVRARHDLTAALTLANDSLYRPSSIGGTYLGVNDDGLYEFEVTIPADFQSQPTPLEPDHYYLQHEISNPEVLGSRAQYYYGIRPGKSDITYSVSESSDGPFTPKAIVHVTVVSKEDYLALTGLDHIHKWYYSYDSDGPTCIKESVSSRKCMTCGENQIIEVRPKLEHQYESRVTTPATATKSGVRTYTCSLCGDSYTETIQKIGGTTESVIVKDPNAKAAVSSNQGEQNYSWYASKPVTSYLYERQDGNLTRVECIEGKVVVENYDSSFQLLTSDSVPMELELFGGFYAGEGYNFLIFGQQNPEESQSKEVVRVVKYSKDWKRLDASSLKGANTTIPFRAGSLRCAEYNGMLYITTSHQMFKSKDRLNHQSNLLIGIRESDMAITDSRYDVLYAATGYVSHSFNQFILVDESGRLVTMDHGDAYPRSAVLFQYKNPAGSEKFGTASYGEVMTFYGAIGENYTNAALGGLAASGRNYLSVMNTAVQNGSANSKSVRNVVLYVTGQSDLNSTKTVQLTNYSAGGTTSASVPQLVKLSEDRFLVLWEINTMDQYGNFEADGTICYVIVDGSGKQIGQAQSGKARLSDCQPITVDGKAVWYVTSNSAPKFYEINQNGSLTAYSAASSGTQQLGQSASGLDFKDVPANAYYLDAVKWAVDQNITGGTSANTFSPNASCTRAQMVTFLWRAAGSPAPKSTTNPFKDISSTDYFYNAVLWAVEQGITSGTGADTFSPGATVTRGQTVTFLHRAAGSPLAGSSGFNDVSDGAYYAKAVAWANENGITSGTGSNKFSPGADCTRSQIVTLLYRANN